MKHHAYTNHDDKDPDFLSIGWLIINTIKVIHKTELK